jgi:hypothetical protein
MTDEREKLRRAVRRGNATPSTNVLETEVRSQGAPNFQTEGGEDLLNKIPYVGFWEWNYGVPASDIREFIEDLQNDEVTLIDLICEILGEDQRLIDYRGTFISATSERGWYECRTVWSYIGDEPIAQWVPLLENDQFKFIFQKIRRRFARDPGATERLMSLLQLYQFPRDFIDEDTTSPTAEGQKALLEASIGLE